MENIVTAFVTFFVVVDPIGVSATFAALTRQAGVDNTRRVALKGTSLALIILVVFFFVGEELLRTLAIGVDAFRIAGGIFLFLLAVDMVFARQSGLRSTTSREQAEAARREDISVFPLAFPLIAGPGALTTVILMATNSSGFAVKGVMLGIVVAVLAITVIALALASRLMRMLGETGANVISRLLGLILAALAVQYVLDGIRGGLGVGA